MKQQINRAIILTSTIAAFGLLSACSSTTESIETKDVFTQAADVVVPAPPIDTTLNIGVLPQPPVLVAPPVFETVQNVQPFVPEPAPFVEPPYIEPAPVEVTVTPNFEPAPSVGGTIAFDCSIVPTTKSELSTYKVNCL